MDFAAGHFSVNDFVYTPDESLLNELLLSTWATVSEDTFGGISFIAGWRGRCSIDELNDSVVYVLGSDSKDIEASEAFGGSKRAVLDDGPYRSCFVPLMVDPELSSSSCAIIGLGLAELWRGYGMAAVSFSSMRRSTMRDALRITTAESTGCRVSGMVTISNGPMGFVGVKSWYLISGARGLFVTRKRDGDGKGGAETRAT